MEKRERPELEAVEERVKEVKEEEAESVEAKGKYQRAVKETVEEQEEEMKLKIVKAKV